MRKTNLRNGLIRISRRKSTSDLITVDSQNIAPGMVRSVETAGGEGRGGGTSRRLKRQNAYAPEESINDATNPKKGISIGGASYKSAHSANSTPNREVVSDDKAPTTPKLTNLGPQATMMSSFDNGGGSLPQNVTFLDSGSASRLSAATSVSLPIWPQQQFHHPANNLLGVAPPAFVLWPPTPTSSATGAPMAATPEELSLQHLYKIHRGELSASEQYRYALSRAQLKASSRTSALLTGFAMIALVELIYLKTTPPFLLVSLAVVTTLLVSVHLLTLLMSTCLLPYIEAPGCTKDSPHVKLKFYVDLSWLFSTCIGLILFLVEIVIIFFVKFEAIGFAYAAWITTGILVPVLALFILLSYLIHRTLLVHFMERVNDKMMDLQEAVRARDLEMATAGGHQHQQITNIKQFDGKDA